MTTAKHQGSMAKRRIHDAVISGDVKELEMMVKDGASVNEVDSTKDHFTALHWACFSGTLECLHWLLWHGADPTVTTPTGLTAAHIASIRGQDACVQALVNSGVNMAARDHRGSTPLHMAATHGHSFTLHSLLRAGVEVNVVDKNGWTPLHCAAFHGRLSCLQLLVRWGCLLDDTENAGCTTAHLAAMEGHLDCLKFICSESPISAVQVLGARNNNGETPKMLAENFYKSEVVEYIENIEWERTHPEEASNLAFPAHVAAYTGDLEHLRMLIENQIVTINERDDKGSTPAHKAAGQGHVDILQWLMEMGADMTISNLAGETPRDVARRFARLAAVRLLGRGQEEADEAADRALQPDGDDDDDDDCDDDDVGKGKDKKRKASKSKNHEREARGRAKKKMEELERMLEIATKNYVQLGGVVKGDQQRREREERETRRAESPVDRNIADLEMQLDQERNRREKLEVKLDQYKLDVAYLTSQLDQLSTAANNGNDYRGERQKKTIKKKTGNKEDGFFFRRNVGSARKGQSPLKIL